MYNDVLEFMKMADQYFYLIDEMGEETDERIKKFEKELTDLRSQKSNLLMEKNQLQGEKSSIEGRNKILSERLNLKSDKEKLKSGGGSGISTAIPTPPKDCTSDINAYKTKVQHSINLLQEDIQKIRGGVNNISVGIIPSKKKLDKKKMTIEESIVELEKKINELMSQ